MKRYLHFRKFLAPARRQRGFSKFEFALAAALFAALTGIAADRLHAVQEIADTVAAKQLIVSLQAALTLKTAQLTAAQRQADMAALADQNPIGWLSRKPPNYLGEFYAPDNQRLPPGNWYFDRRDKTLVYFSGSRKVFASRTLNLLKFKVKSSRTPTVLAATPASDKIDNLALIQVFDGPGLSGQ